MSVEINKKGDLIITIPTDGYLTPIEQLELRRGAVSQALTEHDNKEFIGSDLHYGLVEILNDLSPTEEQWKKVFKSGF